MATAPAHASGTVRVKVIAAGGVTADTPADDFTYVASPAITSISPTSGPIAGGTTVVITGAELTGVNAVSFGETAATNFTVDSATQITAVAPAHAAGTVQVKATNAQGPSPDTAADDYTYVGPPTIAALDPPKGPVEGGNNVVIAGGDFIDVSGVFFGDVKAEYAVDSPTQITAVAPPGPAGTVRVQVIAAGGSTLDTAADDYSYGEGLSAARASLPSLWSRLQELLRSIMDRLQAAPPGG
jgi:hypothetical protein